MSEQENELLRAVQGELKRQKTSYIKWLLGFLTSGVVLIIWTAIQFKYGTDENFIKINNKVEIVLQRQTMYEKAQDEFKTDVKYYIRKSQVKSSDH